MRLPAGRAMCFALACACLASCGRDGRTLAPKHQTWAELRTIRSGVTITPPGESARLPYPRERLADGAVIELKDHALAWLRRDGGETLLVGGPAVVELMSQGMRLRQGLMFVETPPQQAASLETASGRLHLGAGRASIAVSDNGEVQAYVLAGELRTDRGHRAEPGQKLTIAKGNATVSPVVVWNDWTGGLATTDPEAAPAPFGVGTVGARLPEETGKPRWPLTIQRLEVHVDIDKDLAITEVEQVFFNPTAATVEGIYRFRTPPGATLHRFGVDRDGALIWGHVKEQKQAAAQYQAHVYAGSTEDPALLEWEAPGVYRAKLYPIEPGASRRVVTRYAEWLGRSGERGERRLYVYPMAAQGAEASLPRIEELTVHVDLQNAGAQEVRMGMAGVRQGHAVVVRAHDIVPRADLAVELYDEGLSQVRGYVAEHQLDPSLLAPDDRGQKAGDESDYLLVPLRAAQPEQRPKGLDLAVVVDASAATDPGALSMARSATDALLTHLGPDDRVAVWVGDVGLRAVAPGTDKLGPVTAETQRQVSAGLARIERGGATDLGAILTEAASVLQPHRNGVLVYVGDGVPTVGELQLPEIRERLGRLPRPVRICTLGVGEGANMQLLAGVAHGSFSEQVADAHSASRAALRLLEEAERPGWLATELSLGPDVERIYPRDVGTVPADETVLVVGRLKGKAPQQMAVTAGGRTEHRPLRVERIDDRGDMMRRWAEGRLMQLLDEGAGRAAVVEVGMRYGILTPFTSYYVPTQTEVAADARLASNVERSPARLGKRKVTAVSEDTEAVTVEERTRGEKANFKEQAPPPPAPAEPAKPAAPVLARPAPRAAATTATGRAASPAAAAATVDAPVAGGETAAQAPGLGVSSPAKGAGHTRDRAKNDEAEASTAMTGDAWGAAGLGLASGGQAQLEDEKKPALSAAEVVDGSGTGPGYGRHAGNVLRSARIRLPKLDESQSSKRIGVVSHRQMLCSPAAMLPVGERIALWKERLRGTSPYGAVNIYRNALATCEAPTWRERSSLLSLMVDALGTVHARASLWRLLAHEPGTGDAIYGMILTRIRNASDLRALHDALGLKSIDQVALQKALKEATTPAARVQKLRELLLVWPDDLWLHVKLLHALEDASDPAGARLVGRKLRASANADAAVRTAVGELYLRLASSPDDADAREGLRAFGEIVEFAHDDPVARRRLGDLFRAHGWHEQAARQYETLERLRPDDATVLLVRAAAAQGMGRTEEAVRWAEKAAAASSPDGLSDLARTARAMALTFLAWARDEARTANRTQDLEKLFGRTTQLLSRAQDGPGIRVALVWAHPDFHPTMWTNALGAMMPASEGHPMAGISQNMLPAGGGQVEVRVEPQDLELIGRYRTEAILTVVFDEGKPNEHVVRLPVGFASDGKPVLRFRIANRTVTQEEAR